MQRPKPRSRHNGAFTAASIGFAYDRTPCTAAGNQGATGWNPNRAGTVADHGRPAAIPTRRTERWVIVSLIGEVTGMTFGAEMINGGT